MKKGYIYVMTNPAFPEYVKIGYAADVNRRLRELNLSSAIPYAFRVYATYEVDSNLSDKKLHLILDKLNPDLRTKETVNGKERKREFYALAPEDIYSILEAIAEINGFKNKLSKNKLTDEDKKEQEEAMTIDECHRQRQENFSFKKAEIMVGEELTFCKWNGHNDSKIIVVDDKNHVEYEGITYSLSGLAKYLLGKQKKDGGIAGPNYFLYKGEALNKIMTRKIAEPKET